MKREEPTGAEKGKENFGSPPHEVTPPPPRLGGNCGFLRVLRFPLSVKLILDMTLGFAGGGVLEIPYK